MHKRVLTLFLGVIMLTAMLTQGLTVSARAAQVDFTLSATNGKVGDTITVSLDLSADSYFTNATFYLGYDTLAVEFVEEGVGSISPSMNTMFMAQDYSDRSYVKGVYVTVNGITKGGTLLTFDFKVIKNTPAVFSLSFDECIGVDENDHEFDLKYQIKGCVANNDGSVTLPSSNSSALTTTKAGGTTTKTGNKTATTKKANDQSTDSSNDTAQTTTGNGNATTAVTNEAGNIITTTGDGTATADQEAMMTDAQGSMITTTTLSDNDSSENGSNGLSIGVVIVLVCAAIAVALALVAVKLRKKTKEETLSSVTESEDSSASSDSSDNDSL